MNQMFQFLGGPFRIYKWQIAFFTLLDIQVHVKEKKALSILNIQHTSNPKSRDEFI